jgi:hypothetical protein
MIDNDNAMKISNVFTYHDYETESETNRTFPVRVRFGSTEFLKSRFGFGSVWLNFQKVSSDSVRFD